MPNSMLYRAGKGTLVEYFQTTSLNGFRLLYYIRRRKYQRLIWSAFIAMGFAFTTYVVLYTLFDFFDHPTVTSLVSRQDPIWRHPYPAVAVCSSNLFSRRAVETFVRQEILSRSNKDAEYWLRKMHLLAAYFDRNAVDAQQARLFQQELEATLGLKNDSFNPGPLLFRLAPSCEDLMWQCYWAREPIDCGRSFRLHAFAGGNCCVFNHKRINNGSTVLYPVGIGADMGLTLLLNTSKDDHLLAAASGFTLHIFGVTSHLDGASGHVRHSAVGGGDDVRLTLSLITQSTTAEARGHRVQGRRCLFPDERMSQYGSHYSNAACLMRCKMRSIWRKCGCIPHYMHPEQSKEIDDFVYCNLAHVDCLRQHRVTWESYISFWPSKVPFGAEQMLQQSLSCPDCLPRCMYHMYNIRKSRTKLSQSWRLLENKNFFTNASAPFDSEKVSVVRLNYATPHATHYVKHVLFNWYQILSNIGGVIGICMGCSFISGFEIIYFVAFRLCAKYRHAS